MDLSSIRSAYLIGIKGAGMTALAQVLQARGVRVFGSDTDQHFYTDDVLRRAGIPFVEWFAATNVPSNVDIVIRSTAYAEDHVEVEEATHRNLIVTTYPEALAAIFNAGKGIAVCGTHGKSTTTAMLGHVLAEAGLDPTVIVGAEVPQFGGNARVGRSDLVVVEADEYQNKFHALNSYGIVLTSIEWDHPDFFPTPEAYADAFRAFVRKLPTDGFLAACGDDAAVREVTRGVPCGVMWYGLTHPPTPPLPKGGGEIKKNFSPARGEGEREGVGNMRILLPGRHNIQNALGVLAAAERLGVPRDVALRAIASFQGTRRRFEIIGEVTPLTVRGGEGELRSDRNDNPPHPSLTLREGAPRGEVVVIDDYGHHPTEIRVTLAAARERYPGRRILCAFHPHTFTRTIALKDQFATAFVDADWTYVMNIFGSARERQGGITPSELAASISIHGPAIASGGVEQTVAALTRDVQPGDVVICMGAGENDRVARGLVERLRENAGVRNPM